jgi:small redox-active disulfide protein 2
MKSILVLGPGCAKCRRLKVNVDRAVQQSGLAATVEHVTDMQTILAFDVLTTPALIVDGRTVVVGRVLSVDELHKLLLVEPGE